MGSQHGQRYRQIVCRIEELLRNDRGEQLHVDDLCRAASVSERTLRNAFRKIHGVSPYRYLARLPHDPGAAGAAVGQFQARDRDRSRDAVRLPRARPVFRRLSLGVRRVPFGDVATRAGARGSGSAADRIRRGCVPDRSHGAVAIRRTRWRPAWWRPARRVRAARGRAVLGSAPDCGGGWGGVWRATMPLRPLPRPARRREREIGGGAINLVLRMARRIDAPSRSGPRFIFKHYLCLVILSLTGVRGCIEMARSHLRYLNAI